MRAHSVRRHARAGRYYVAVAGRLRLSDGESLNAQLLRFFKRELSGAIAAHSHSHAHLLAYDSKALEQAIKTQELIEVAFE